MNDTTSRTDTSTQVSSSKVSVLSEGLCKFLDALVEEMVKDDMAHVYGQVETWTKKEATR